MSRLPLVVIDADVLGRRRTGDETYVANLLRELATLAPSDLRLARLPRPRAQPATPASARNCAGLSDLQPFKVIVVFDLDVGHHDGQHLVVTSSPILVRHRSLLVGAESVPPRITQGRKLSPALDSATTPNYSVRSRTLRVKQLLGLGLLHG